MHWCFKHPCQRFDEFIFNLQVESEVSSSTSNSFFLLFLFPQIYSWPSVLLHCGHALPVPMCHHVHHHSACPGDALQMLS